MRQMNRPVYVIMAYGYFGQNNFSPFHSKQKI